MARLGVVSDIHIGNHKIHGGPVVSGINTRCRLVLDALERALDTAREHRCERFYVLGDLYDTAKPEPQIEAEAIRILRKYTPDVPAADRPVEVDVLLGNHEMVSTAEGDHALGPLQRAGIGVIDKPMLHGDEGVDVICLPFRPGDAREWLPLALNEHMEKWHANGALNNEYRSFRVLLLHVGIYDNRTAPFLQVAHDAVSVSMVQELMQHYSIDMTLAGNWHQRRVWRIHADESLLVQSTKDGDVLALDGGEAARVRTFQQDAGGRPSVRAHTGLGRFTRFHRSDDDGFSGSAATNRSRMPSSALCEPSAHGVGHAARKSVAGAQRPGEERAKDLLPERASVQRGEHVSQPVNGLSTLSRLHQVERLILQVGALCPADYGDAPPYGTLAIVDTDTGSLEIVEIPGPRFKTVRALGTVMPVYDAKQQGDTVFVRVEGPPEEREQCMEWITAKIGEGIIADGSYSTDTEQIKERAKQAAIVASDQVSTEELIDAYINELQLPEGVNKQNVIERVKGYVR